jgi:hypothetical protein
MSLTNLPVELQIEILKKSDPETLINFCIKNYEYKSHCNNIFRYLLKEMGFKINDKDLDYSEIYQNIYYTNIEIFKNKNISMDKCYDKEFIKWLLYREVYSTIKFLQSQNYKSIYFDMRDNKEIELDKVYMYITEDNLEDFEEIKAKEITDKYKKSKLYKKCPLKRGDIIKFDIPEMPYDIDMENGMFIFDGIEFKHLRHFNNYYIPSKEFLVINEFPIRYFNKSIDKVDFAYSDLRGMELKLEKKFRSYNSINQIYSFYYKNIKYGLEVYVYNGENISIDNILKKIEIGLFRTIPMVKMYIGIPQENIICLYVGEKENE